MSERSKRPTIPIALPPHIREHDAASTVSSKASNDSSHTDASTNSVGQPIPKPGMPLQPPIFSILVVCPLPQARAAIVSHIELTIPKPSAHHLTVQDSISDCAPLLTGENPVIFSHIFIDVRSVAEIAALLHQLLRSAPHAATCIAIATDPRHRREIKAGRPGQGPHRSRTALRRASWGGRRSRRRGACSFVFKPLKTNKVATVFDPRGVGELARRTAGATGPGRSRTGRGGCLTSSGRGSEQGVAGAAVEDNMTSQKVGGFDILVSLRTLTRRRSLRSS